MMTVVKNSEGEEAFYCLRAKGDAASVPVPVGRCLIAVNSDGDAGVVAQGPHDSATVEIVDDLPPHNWFAMLFIVSPHVADRVVNRMSREDRAGMIDSVAAEYGLFDRTVMH